MATTLRSIRVPDDPWLPALARAQREGTTVSDVVRDFLTAYAHMDARPPATQPEEE